MTALPKRTTKFTGKDRTGGTIHLEFPEDVEAPDVAVYLMKENEDGMVPVESCHFLPLWAIKEIRDYYERTAPLFPGDSPTD